MLRFLQNSRRSRPKSRTSRRDARSIANAPGRTVLHQSAALPKGAKKTRSRSQVPAFLEEPGILPTDLRVFSPEAPTPRLRSGKPASVVSTPVLRSTTAPSTRPRALLHPSTLLFQNAKNVDVCVKRSQRKEILHATKKAGKVGQQRAKRTANSSIIC